MDINNELKSLFLMQQVYASLFSVYNKLNSESARRFVTLSSRQYMAILAILHLPKSETTINNIAKKLGTTKQNTKQLITALEKKRYIEVKPSDMDRRAANIEVTPAGMDEMLMAGEVGIMLLADVFHDFSDDEMQMLWDLLKKVYRFDGQEQDGFEQDPNESLSMDEREQEAQMRAFQAFIEKRGERNHDKG